MVLRILSVLVFIANLSDIKSAKILAVFPMPSISHQVVFRPLTQELAKRGHDVTIITPDPAFPKGEAPQNITEIDIHDISYQTWHSYFLGDHKIDGKSVHFKDLRQICSLIAYIFEIQSQSPEIQKLITNKNNKYDLILIEALVRPALVYSHIFKAPVILVSSLGIVLNNHKIMGLYTHPLLYPSMLQKRVYNLTLAEKFQQLYLYYSLEYADYLNEFDDNEVLRKNFGSGVPPLSELYNNIEMLFVNVNPIWANNQPVPPNVLYIGGIHHMPQKELPKNLKAYLDLSKYGVIYLSFGTNVLSEAIPPEKVQIFVNVLSKLSYDVLWKWDKDELPGQSDNIKIAKWYPQSDLLKHPNVKLFITQAGLQSTDEAIDAGVPLVAIPMLGDQWYNAEKYVKLGIGKKLEIETLTEEKFRNAVESVISNATYRSNIAKLRDLIRDQPDTSLQRAVWWSEYIIRHGGAKHFRPQSANISYSQYFEIKILFILLLGILAILATFIFVILYVLKRIKSYLLDKIKIKKN